MSAQLITHVVPVVAPLCFVCLCVFVMFVVLNARANGWIGRMDFEWGENGGLAPHPLLGGKGGLGKPPRPMGGEVGCGAQMGA